MNHGENQNPGRRHIHRAGRRRGTPSDRNHHQHPAQMGGGTRQGKETAMNNTGADIAISMLGKLIDQELAAVRAASRDGNRPLYEFSSTRYHAYLTAKDEIRKALADAVEERDGSNPFLPQRDEWVTMDMHTCETCAAALARVPSTACYLPMAAKRRPSRRCAPTVCGVSNSSRSKPSHWTPTVFSSSGFRLDRTRKKNENPDTASGRPTQSSHGKDPKQ